MATTEPKLTIEIKNTREIELGDLITSYQGIASEYRAFITKNGGLVVPDDVKLYVNELRTGSIIADLVPLAHNALPFIEHANEVMASAAAFTVHLKKSYDFLLGKDVRKVELEKQNYVTLSNIVEPVVKD